MTALLVALYLGAVIAANLVIAAYGPSAAIVVAFALIGLDLTVRDALHDRWQGRQLWGRMLALIVGGGLLSWAVNPAAGQIAAASSISFVAASSADAVVYQLVRRRRWLTRVNVSNVAGSAVDSVLFPTLAFGALLPVIVLGQFVAKVVGGALWSVMINALSVRKGAGRAAGDAVTLDG